MDVFNTLFSLFIMMREMVTITPHMTMMVNRTPSIMGWLI
jgi:hypothetical protein